MWWDLTNVMILNILLTHWSQLFIVSQTSRFKMWGMHPMVWRWGYFCFNDKVASLFMLPRFAKANGVNTYHCIPVSSHSKAPYFSNLFQFNSYKLCSVLLVASFYWFKEESFVGNKDIENIRFLSSIFVHPSEQRVLAVLQFWSSSLMSSMLSLKHWSRYLICTLWSKISFIAGFVALIASAKYSFLTTTNCILHA